MAENIQVGKYTLESLTTGMYSDPKIIYREYIQNSVDALEMAVEQNLLSVKECVSTLSSMQRLPTFLFATMAQAFRVQMRSRHS